ncbi:hypothetical protein XENTR_v10007599 [Xenopus tropicalis]|nr:hypothetical protein XENTR_v10007599 [Xenopus tropicalis]
MAFWEMTSSTPSVQLHAAQGKKRQSANGNIFTCYSHAAPIGNKCPIRGRTIGGAWGYRGAMGYWQFHGKCSELSSREMGAALQIIRYTPICNNWH